MALDLPPEAREAIGAWARAALGGCNELRLVPEAALHVTLVFLGSVEADRVQEAWEATAGGAEGHKAPVLAVSGLTGLPRGGPRLFALGLSDLEGRAAALHKAVAAELDAARLYEAGGRPFWPHVTVARVRRGERPPQLALDPPPIPAFCAPAVTLYRSRPGSSYEALERLELTAD